MREQSIPPPPPPPPCARTHTHTSQYKRTHRHTSPIPHNMQACTHTSTHTHTRAHTHTHIHTHTRARTHTHAHRTTHTHAHRQTDTLTLVTDHGIHSLWVLSLDPVQPPSPFCPLLVGKRKRISRLIIPYSHYATWIWTKNKIVLITLFATRSANDHVCGRGWMRVCVCRSRYNPYLTTSKLFFSLFNYEHLLSAASRDEP